MDPVLTIQQVLISALLGLLVGLQRERTDARLAGFRTFPLITIFGTLCAVVSQALELQWLLPTGLFGIVGVIVIGNLAKLQQGDTNSGVTSEVAMLVMFLVGAFVVFGPWIIAAAVAGGTAILLQYKPQMHGFAARLGEQDVRAVMQFVLITFIILPIVPNKSYDPVSLLHPLFPETEFPEFDILNPYQIWLLVVLVVGISMGGYVCYKIFGSRAGTVLAGILGGTISSTATTASYARQTSSSPAASPMAAVVVIIASTVSYLRVLLEIAVVAPGFLRDAVGPVGSMLGFSALLAIVAWWRFGGGEKKSIEPENPTELKSALVFASVFAVVLVAVAVGRHYLDDRGVYAVAALSGMTDMDAITLSTARLVQSERLDASIGWRLVIVATMSNLVFKGIIVAAVGHRRLLKPVSVLFGLSSLTGALILALWPG